MKKVFILASKGLSLTSRIIKWWQFGYPYTHVALVYDLRNLVNPFVIEMWWNGLRSGLFSDAHTPETPFTIFSVMVNEEQERKLREWVYEKIGEKPKYDWLGILGFPLRNKNIESKKRYFCSEFVFAAFQNAGVELLRDTKPSEVSPRILLKSPLLNLEYSTILKEMY